MENEKRLERSRTNRVVAGVCAGLANYFKIDIALMRVLFVVATICGSFGFWMYVILWIVVPEENILEQSYSDRDDTIDITPKDEKKINNGAMIASFVLIFIGIIALLDNFAYITWVWKLWPVTLIIIGVMILIKSKDNRHE
ncbi:MAG: PspC domain-containing protein [Bacteroidales bacterium]|nr:PspC domain-containing protein [Bacteroidales bacterium]